MHDLSADGNGCDAFRAVETADHKEIRVHRRVQRALGELRIRFVRAARKARFDRLKELPKLRHGLKIVHQSHGAFSARF